MAFYRLLLVAALIAASSAIPLNDEILPEDNQFISVDNSARDQTTTASQSAQQVEGNKAETDEPMSLGEVPLDDEELDHGATEQAPSNTKLVVPEALQEQTTQAAAGKKEAEEKFATTTAAFTEQTMLVSPPTSGFLKRYCGCVWKCGQLRNRPEQGTLTWNRPEGRCENSDIHKSHKRYISFTKNQKRLMKNENSRPLALRFHKRFYDNVPYYCLFSQTGTQDYSMQKATWGSIKGNGPMGCKATWRSIVDAEIAARSGAAAAAAASAAATPSPPRGEEFCAVGANDCEFKVAKGKCYGVAVNLWHKDSYGIQHHGADETAAKCADRGNSPSFGIQGWCRSDDATAEVEMKFTPKCA